MNKSFNRILQSMIGLKIESIAGKIQKYDEIQYEAFITTVNILANNNIFLQPSTFYSLLASLLFSNDSFRLLLELSGFKSAMRRIIHGTRFLFYKQHFYKQR